MSDVSGWVRVATFTEGQAPPYEEAGDFARTTATGDVRSVEWLGQDSRLEVRTETGQRWVPLARFDGADAYQDGEQVVDEIEQSDEYRVVSVKDDGVYLERRVGGN